MKLSTGSKSKNLEQKHAETSGNFRYSSQSSNIGEHGEAQGNISKTFKKELFKLIDFRKLLFLKLIKW